jgi:phage baseplate assembly protein W
MSEFERKLPNVRLAEIHQGDTLQRIAAREMGDANRWPELVWINSLTHPYVTGDQRQVVPGVLMYGQLIKVPAPRGVYTDDADRGQVYERDCALVGRMLTDDGVGDLSVVAGADNLRQQLSHVVATPRGQATRHPQYGCMAWRLLGTVTGPTANKLGAEYVKSALLSDYRVSRVEATTAITIGDSLNITARAIAIEGSVVDLNLGTSGNTGGTDPANSGWGNNYGNNWGN